MRPLGPGLLCVATREVLWIWRDRIALLLVVAIPLAAFAILAATFSHADCPWHAQNHTTASPHAAVKAAMVVRDRRV